MLRFDDGVVPATLADNETARDLAGLLPVTLDLRDAMGQAMVAKLPRALATSSVEPVRDPGTGGLYWVPGSAMIAIYYDDLGQTVPPPGLVRIGTVDDLDSVVGGGHRVLIDLADRATS